MKKMRIASVLTAVVLFATTVPADNRDLSPSTDRLEVTTEREPINTIDPLYRAYMTVGSEKFSFFVPAKFRLGGDTLHGRLTVSSFESDVNITLVFLDHLAGGRELSKDFCHEILAERYPNGKIVEEFTRPILGRGAITFDVEWKTADGLLQKARASFVPTVAGTMELTVSGGMKKFTASVQSFNEVAGSLEAAVNGKLKVSHYLNVN